MRKIAVIMGVLTAITSSQAAAGQRLAHKTPYGAEPRPVAAFAFAARRVEMLAVTRRARADTALRRAHLDECQSMAKVFPGYPQPAFVSLDFRVRF